ncbi:MAG TPA: hypothetical protein VFM05_05730, partial [Candidatus Saccharimonadales bacterium]|nr:hypothetical protein [Candidatus Saccharimonadales bacterium]
MIRRCLKSLQFLGLCGLLVGMSFLHTPGAIAQTATTQNPKDGAIGLEGKIPSKPPATAPTITTPSNGAVFNQIPITVGGLCTTGLLVKIFANNVFVGSVMCERGSYSLQVDLFPGRNDLVARAFDTFDQSSP